VPGRETNLPASAARYSTGLATAPIDNFVSEFLPDLARHIHVQVVAFGTGTINYAWQVSTNSGATWNFISNGADYGGVSSATLTVHTRTGLNHNWYRAQLTDDTGLYIGPVGILTLI
jgi:hypothetical protein